MILVINTCSSFSKNKLLMYNLMYTRIKISIIYNELKYTQKF